MTDYTTESEFPIPSVQCLKHCVKLGVVDDKPIMMDYWTESHKGTVFIGVKENDEKLLVKSEDEYTSPIAKIFKAENEYIVVTENSLYVVSCTIPSKRIS